MRHLIKNKKLDNISIKIGILNLMPDLEETERNFKILLDNSLLNIDLDFIYLETKKNKKECIKRKYKSFSSIKNSYYDGMIVTGAPLEQFNYEDINFISEFKEFLEFTIKYVKSTIFLCWASEFALNYFYNIRRIKEKNKVSGLYEHYIVNDSYLVKGFSETFFVPQSRYYSILESDIVKSKRVLLVSKSKETGPFIIESKDGKQIFMTGHLEYNRNTLDKEYKRDLKRGLSPLKPNNYYFNDKPRYIWQTEATLLYHNWLYYIVFKE